MTRYEPRDFYTPIDYELEPRVVDLDAQDVHLPSGSVIMCANGHVAAQIVNSIDSYQLVQAGDFAPLQPGMTFQDDEEYPICACGSHLFREDYGRLQVNVQGRGWVPDYEECVMFAFDEGWDAPERSNYIDTLCAYWRSIADTARVIAGIREKWRAA